MSTPRPSTPLRLAWTVLPRLVLGSLLFACPLLPALVAGSPSSNLWWSLKPVTAVAVPDDASDLPNPIDRFARAALRSKGLVPVEGATKPVLLRRLYLDLTGLPPTTAEQDAYLADDSAEAYGKVVDRLLASEQHAVRYTRRWLDVLRYADLDEHLPASAGVHLWRDWMIKALQEDLPYDHFVRVQLTGQRSASRTQISATGHRFRVEPRPDDLFALGFLARGAGADPQDLAIASVETVSGAFMGMTVGCAKCHDHRYDPITQRDFYAMKALFDPLVIRKVPLASASELFASGKTMAEVARKRALIEQPMNALAEPYRNRLREERIRMLPAEIQSVIHKVENERTVAEQKIADDYYPILRIDPEKITEVMSKEDREQYQEYQKQLRAVGEGPGAGGVPVFWTVENDRLRETAKSYILTSGDPARPRLNEEVTPGWPFASAPPDFRDGRIEAFSDWLTSAANPLFARVAVNRLWQWHFGTGLVKTPNDFGQLGGMPSNPALLDWLASEFVRRNFSMREMHRLIVTSRTYQMASQAPAESAANLASDPDNSLLWHFPLQRLEAEPVLDSIHAAAGNLDLAVGGPSYELASAKKKGGKPPEESAGHGYRRAAYITRGFSSSRDVLPAFLQDFDVDDGRVPCPVRTQTVTAPQALFLMNSAEIDAAAEALAKRLAKETEGNPARSVDLGFRLVLSRGPTDSEKREALAYIGDDPERLRQFAWMLFNLDEFIYVR